MPKRFWKARSSSPSFLAAQTNDQATTANVKALTTAINIPRNVLIAAAYDPFGASGRFPGPVPLDCRKSPEERPNFGVSRGCRDVKKPSLIGALRERADDGTRTHDLLHSKDSARTAAKRHKPPTRTVERCGLLLFRHEVTAGAGQG